MHCDKSRKARCDTAIYKCVCGAGLCSVNGVCKDQFTMDLEAEEAADQPPAGASSLEEASHCKVPKITDHRAAQKVIDWKGVRGVIALELESHTTQWPFEWLAEWPHQWQESAVGKCVMAYMQKVKIFKMDFIEAMQLVLEDVSAKLGFRLSDLTILMGKITEVVDSILDISTDLVHALLSANAFATGDM